MLSFVVVNLCIRCGYLCGFWQKEPWVCGDGFRIDKLYKFWQW